jgi:secreted trypsin-like serine protease
MRTIPLVAALCCSFFITSSLAATWPRDWTKTVPQTQKIGDGIELQIFGSRAQGIRIFIHGTKFEDRIGDGQISKVLTQKASEDGQHYNIAVRYGTDGDLYRAYAVVGDSVIRCTPYRNTAKGDTFIDAAWESPNHLAIYGKQPKVLIFRVDSNDWTIANPTKSQVQHILQSQSQQVKLAHDFAAGLTIPNEAKIQSFAAAYNLANDARKGASPTAETQPIVATNPTELQKSALKDPTFQYNFGKTVEAAENGKSNVEPIPVEWRVLGGLTTDAFTDCVAVGTDHHFFCSGTLIGKRLVLTARHCLNHPKWGKPNMILFGASINDGTPIDVVKIIPYSQLSLQRHPINDLSLLILKDPVPDNVTIRSVATEEQLYKSYQVTLVGFGTDTSNGSQGFGVKREVDVPIVTYDGWQGDGNAPFGCDVGLEFVASSLEIFRPRMPAPRTNSEHKASPQRKDTCEGDSGGPAYVRGSGDNWVLAGATSRSILNADQYLPPKEKATGCGDGGVYVRVDKYWSSWIEPVISQEHLESSPTPIPTGTPTPMQ